MATIAPIRSDRPFVRERTPRRTPRGDRTAAGFRVLADVTCEQSLSALIQSEIIPRLMLAHAAGDSPAAPVAGSPRITPADVADLAPLAIAAEASDLMAQVDAVLARGATVDAVLVDLLAPTARLLGEYWESDRCDFVAVTMGLWRLQEVVHDIAGRAPAGRHDAAGGRRALFGAMPGDQHDFGTVVIDELFRRNGWLTERLIETETADLLRAVGDGWFDLVGLTVSCDCHIAPLSSVIAAVRSVSRNPRVCVMVGGRIFSANPALAVEVGADGTAADAKLALQVATELVLMRGGHALAG